VTDKNKSILKDESKGIYLYKSSRYANTLNIETPFNESFIKEVKLMDARWIDKMWTIDIEKKEQACALVDKFFGTSLQAKFLAHKNASIAGSEEATLRILNKGKSS
jgi:hypothetical protein